MLSISGVLNVAESANNQGFIYGEITTRDGDTYKGTMRWGKQEVFWDDLFNASKEDNPWVRYAPKHGRGDRESNIRIFGIKVLKHGYTDHLFLTQFGNIQIILNRRHNRSTIIMKNGTEFDVEDGGDLDVKIRMIDESLGKISLKWDNIKKIEFMPTPKTAKAPGYRLKGKLIIYEKEFEGYIMWDAEECVSTDILDGETKHSDMEIEFGNIRSIKRLNRRSCQVTLKDGRELDLRGTNDVNDENRGIYFQDDRYGKIEVQWSEFKEVIYDDDDGSTGNSYDSYKPGKKLEGTVQTLDGGVFEGEIVYDLDESEEYEMLNGYRDDMEFNIPFNMIKSITPKGRHSSIVELRNGEKLRLEDSHDVSGDHDGIIIFMGKKDNEYVAWKEVEKVMFK